MPKRTVEMNDDMNERIESAKEELREEFAAFRKENPDMDIEAWEPHDRVFEIADSAVPIYTKQIEDLYYLYSDRLDQAYEDAGLGDGTEENHKQVTIFCYIESKLWAEVAELQRAAQDEAESD